jgi:hypothetical protein
MTSLPSPLHQSFNQASLREGDRRRLRGWGYGLLVLAAAALCWDMVALLGHGALVKFAGMIDIWRTLDQGGFALFQDMVENNLGPTAWRLLLQPMMSLPVSLLLGLPGFWLMRKYSPEIKVRAPDDMEREIEALGLHKKRRR